MSIQSSISNGFLSAYGVITNIFSQFVVEKSLSITDQTEILFIGSIIIVIFIMIISKSIQVLISERHKSNELLILFFRVVEKAQFFFFFITINFFIIIMKIHFLVFDLPWHRIFAFSIIVLGWLFLLLPKNQ